MPWIAIPAEIVERAMGSGTELGSIFTAMFGIIFAYYCGGRANQFWNDGRFILGAGLFCLGILLFANATFGILLGLDLWSIGRRIL